MPAVIARGDLLRVHDAAMLCLLADGSMITSDGLTLAISDAILVLNTGLCVPFAKAVAKGWIRYYYTGLIIQHLWQCAVLAIAVTWTFNRCVCCL